MTGDILLTQQDGHIAAASETGGEMSLSAQAQPLNVRLRLCSSVHVKVLFKKVLLYVWRCTVTIFLPLIPHQYKQNQCIPITKSESEKMLSIISACFTIMCFLSSF